MMWKHLLDLRNHVVDRRTRKGIVRVTLEAAFEQENCPLCRLLLRQEERWLMVFLAESVLDLGIRRQILASWGLCRRHAWALATRSDSGSALVTALIYENLVGSLLQHCAVQQTAGREEPLLAIGSPGRLTMAVPGQSCPACLARDRVERNYIVSFHKYCSLPAFAAAYQASDGFCPRHLARVLAQARPAVRTLLLRHRISRLEAPPSVLAETTPPFFGLPAELGQQLGRLVGPFPFFPGSIDAQRHTPSSALVHSAALDQGSSCPACQEKQDIEQDLLATILQTSEPDGVCWLCPEHAWMLYAMAWRSRAAAPFQRWLQGMLAVEIAGLQAELDSEPVASTEVHRWRRPGHGRKPEPPPRHECIVCSARAEAASRWAAKVAVSAQEMPPDCCLTHAALVLQTTQGESANALQHRLLQRAWDLHTELGLYIHKAHWENRHEPWGAERDSWWRAVRFFVGDE